MAFYRRRPRPDAENQQQTALLAQYIAENNGFPPYVAKASQSLPPAADCKPSVKKQSFFTEYVIPHRGFPVKKNTDHQMATGIFSSKGRGSYPSSRKLSRVKR